MLYDPEIISCGTDALNNLLNPSDVDESIKNLTPYEMYAIGFCGIYEKTELITIDEALDYLKKGSELGNSDCYLEIGLYLYGIFKKNSELAMEYYTKSIQSGGTKAYHAIGVYYYNKKEFEKAREYYIKCINANNEYSTMSRVHLALVIKNTNNNNAHTAESLKYLEEAIDDEICRSTACKYLSDHYASINDEEKANEYMEMSRNSDNSSDFDD